MRHVKLRTLEILNTEVHIQQGTEFYTVGVFS